MDQVYLSYLGNSIELPPGETLIGRDLACRLRFNDKAVSRRHLRIFVDELGVTAQDLGSRNGTTHNGAPLTGEVRLRHGDVLMIGSRRVDVLIADPTAPFDDEDTATVYPSVESPLGAAVAAVASSQRCPSCREAVDAEDDVCPHCGYGWTGSRPRSPTMRIDLTRTEPLDRRGHARQRVEIPVLYVSENLTVETVAFDLSHGGAYIQTQILDDVGTACTLTMMVDGGPAVAFPGRVCRVVETPDGDHPPGLGVEFEAIGPERRRWLEDALETARSRM